MVVEIYSVPESMRRLEGGDGGCNAMISVYRDDQ